VSASTRSPHLSSAPPAPLGLRRRIARLYYRLRYHVFGNRHGRLALEDVGGVPLLVLPDVFNPVLLRTGRLLAEAVSRAYPDGAGERRSALDVGTGSGIGAVFAARSGFRVAAVDVSPEAVRCARVNVLLNGLEELVDVHAGDLFEPVGEDRFDLVLFNPPFFRGEPKDTLDLAWRGTDVVERFARGLPARLAPGGRALVVLSSDADEPGALAAFEAAGLRWSALERRDLWNEVVTVYSLEARVRW